MTAMRRAIKRQGEGEEPGTRNGAGGRYARRFRCSRFSSDPASRMMVTDVLGAGVGVGHQREW